MRPTIKACSVKVMRSHDYCHFEISLSSEYQLGDMSEEISVQHVDHLRKEAARLADKAVEQYKIAKQWATRSAFQGGEKLIRLQKLAAIIQETPEHERTPEEKAILKGLADESYASHQYDYQDDWQDDGQD